MLFRSCVSEVGDDEATEAADVQGRQPLVAFFVIASNGTNELTSTRAQIIMNDRILSTDFLNAFYINLYSP